MKTEHELYASPNGEQKFIFTVVDTDPPTYGISVAALVHILGERRPWKKEFWTDSLRTHVNDQPWLTRNQMREIIAKMTELIS
jgi:hypothetical protein